MPSMRQGHPTDRDDGTSASVALRCNCRIRGSTGNNNHRTDATDTEIRPEQKSIGSMARNEQQLSHRRIQLKQSTKVCNVQGIRGTTKRNTQGGGWENGACYVSMWDVRAHLPQKPGKLSHAKSCRYLTEKTRKVLVYLQLNATSAGLLPSIAMKTFLSPILQEVRLSLEVFRPLT